jgi:nucleotide-binding universal stress UspA family protein
MRISYPAVERFALMQIKDRPGRMLLYSAAAPGRPGAFDDCEGSMSIKSILVVVSGGTGDDVRLGHAFALAGRHGASVIALHVMPSPMLYFGGPGGEVPVAVIEAQQREAEQRAKALEATVKAQAAKAGTAVEWRCEEGDEVTTAAVHARYSDLVVASPDLARDLVFVAATPVLAVAASAPPAAPKRALVAWNGSREAARALRDALAMLKAVDAVDVVVVDPPGDRPIGVDLGRTLSRHGIKVTVRERLSGGVEAGAVLLEEARTSGADLLVMGAYGHSRFREWVLGGATEEVLDSATIPVLLSH